MGDGSQGEIGELYRARVMEHARKPRNFGALVGATHTAKGYNPLCGDQLTLRLRCEGEHIAAVAFEGAGCALSMASASLLTEAISGRECADARALQAAVMSMVAGPADAALDAALGDVCALSSVRAFPARQKCVTLAWQTLADALDGETPAAPTPSF